MAEVVEETLDPDRHVPVPAAPLAVAPVTLEGTWVRLEPLTLAHHAGLCAVGLDPDLWRWIPNPVHTADDMQAYIETAVEGQAAGTVLPFATVERATGRVIGSTRFGNIDRANRHMEIGWTWVAGPWQRTPVNSEAKYLMLGHAFDTLGCLRVELKTDLLNARSRNAILRLGATQEGIFRNHVITATGRVRHTVYFSIMDGEWPAVKAELETKLARPYPTPPGVLGG
ncbi:MAG TPA: GNAT family protein [Chloroflexia bacterium]|nr:GNAT family protein [Chloroflexia bacterium]